jgi:hypothetical protein
MTEKLTAFYRLFRKWGTSLEHLALLRGHSVAANTPGQLDSTWSHPVAVCRSLSQ